MRRPVTRAVLKRDPNLASLEASRRGAMTMSSWVYWALLSALFAGLTAILAKIGVQDIDSNLATAIRTTVILVFAWSIALFRNTQAFATIPSRTWLFLVLSGLATG